jgi:mevalonate kinase
MWGWTATVIAKVIADQQSESKIISEIIDDISEIKQVIKDVTSTND